MKLSKILALLLAIAVVLFIALAVVVYYHPASKPNDGSLLALFVSDLQTGLQWLLGIGTALTGGTHFINYLTQQLQQSSGKETSPPLIQSQPEHPR